MSHDHAPNNSWLTTTANLPSTTNFTMMAWFRTSVGAVLRGLYGSQVVQFRITSGEALVIRVGSTNVTVLTGIATGVWYWTAIVSSSATNRVGYVSAGLGAITQATNTTSNSTATSYLVVGAATNTGSNPCESEIAAIKIWNAVLTLDELRAERDSFEPKRRANLNRWTPCWSASDVRDYGPLQSNWTANGTIVTGVNPPIRYRRLTPRRAKVVGGGSFTVSVAGTLTSAGAVLKTASRRFPATLTPSAAVLRSAQKGLSASLASAGAISRQPQRTVGGALTMAGALIRGATLVRTGVVAPAAALSRLAQKTLTGALASAGGLAQAVSRRLLGALTPTGSATVTKQIQIALAGALASAGSLARQVQRRIGGTVASSGTLVRSATRIFTGAVASAGSVVQAVSRRIGGALASAGSLTVTKQIQMALAGALASAGTLARQAQRALSGTVASSGAIARTAARTLTAAMALTGAIGQAVARVLTGTLASTGSLTRALVGQLGAAVWACTWFVDRREPDWRVPRADPWSADRREPDWPTKE
jgi:hypothetical protein